MEYKCIFATICLDIENGIFFAKPSGQKKLKLMYLGSVYISNIKRHNMAQLSLNRREIYIIKI